MANRLTVIDFNKLNGKPLNENFTLDSAIDLMLKVCYVNVNRDFNLNCR